MIPSWELLFLPIQDYHCNFCIHNTAGTGWGPSALSSFLEGCQGFFTNIQLDLLPYWCGHIGAPRRELQPSEVCHYTCCAVYAPMLGSVILPPSQVPRWDLTFPYIVVPFLHFISKWFLFHTQTCHLSDLSLVFIPFTSVHLLEIHLSHFLPIILSMCLDFTWTSCQGCKA